MKSEIEKACHKWLHKEYMASPMGGGLPRASLIFNKQKQEICEMSFEGGYKAANLKAAITLKTISKLTTDFATRDYDEPGLSELLVRLNEVLNPKA